MCACAQNHQNCFLLKALNDSDLKPGLRSDGSGYYNMVWECKQNVSIRFTMVIQIWGEEKDGS